MYVSHNVKLNIVKNNVFVTCGNNVMNSVQNQKSVGNTKLEQSKHRPLKNIEVGSGAIEECASFAVCIKRGYEINPPQKFLLKPPLL